MGDRPHFTQLKNFKQKYNLLGTSNISSKTRFKSFQEKDFQKKSKSKKLIWNFDQILKFFFLKSFERFLKKNLAFRAFFEKFSLVFLFIWLQYSSILILVHCVLVYLYSKITKTRRRDSNKGPDERRIG